MSNTAGGMLPYFGSKREMAPEIIGHFRPHDVYYEPFLGGAAVLFQKPPARQEAVTDRNPDVMNLIRCLADESRARWLFATADRWPLSQTLFNECAARLSVPFAADVPDMHRAFDYLAVSWQGPSGLAGTDAKPRYAKRNTASGGSLAARWRGVPDAIPYWHRRFCQVELRLCGAWELIEDAKDREGVLIYADPPYHPDTRSGGNYAFEFTIEDHVRLAKSLRRFSNAQIVVSYRPCPALDELYLSGNWPFTKIEIKANKKLKNAGSDSSVESAAEVIYTNKA